MASNDEDLCTSHADFAVICSFIDKFGEKLGLTLPNIGELQNFFEDTDNVSPLLAQGVCLLLRRINKSVKFDRWERGLQRFAHTYSHQDGWELERFGFKKAKLEVKIRVFKNLLEAQFDLYKTFKDKVNLLGATDLRLQPCGRDKKGVSYWCQLDDCANLRIYSDDQDEETWTLVSSTREELVALIAELESESPPGASREMSIDGSHSGTVTPMGLSEAPTPVDSKAATPVASGRTSPVIDTGQIKEDPIKVEEKKIKSEVVAEKIKEKLKVEKSELKVDEAEEMLKDSESLIGENEKQKQERKEDQQQNRFLEDKDEKMKEMKLNAAVEVAKENATKGRGTPKEPELRPNSNAADEKKLENIDPLRIDNRLEEKPLPLNKDTVMRERDKKQDKIDVNEKKEPQKKETVWDKLSKQKEEKAEGYLSEKNLRGLEKAGAAEKLIDSRVSVRIARLDVDKIPRESHKETEPRTKEAVDLSPKVGEERKTDKVSDLKEGQRQDKFDSEPVKERNESLVSVPPAASSQKCAIDRALKSPFPTSIGSVSITPVQTPKERIPTSAATNVESALKNLPSSLVVTPSVKQVPLSPPPGSCVQPSALDVRQPSKTGPLSLTPLATNKGETFSPAFKGGPLSPTSVPLSKSGPLSPTAVPYGKSGPLSPTTVQSGKGGPLSPTSVPSSKSNPLAPTAVQSGKSDPLSPTSVPCTKGGPLSSTNVQSDKSGPLSPTSVLSSKSGPLSLTTVSHSKTLSPPLVPSGKSGSLLPSSTSITPVTKEVPRSSSSVLGASNKSEPSQQTADSSSLKVQHKVSSSAVETDSTKIPSSSDASVTKTVQGKHSAVSLIADMQSSKAKSQETTLASGDDIPPFPSVPTKGTEPSTPKDVPPTTSVLTLKSLPPVTPVSAPEAIPSTNARAPPLDSVAPPVPASVTISQSVAPFPPAPGTFPQVSVLTDKDVPPAAVVEVCKEKSEKYFSSPSHLPTNITYIPTPFTGETSASKEPPSDQELSSSTNASSTSPPFPCISTSVPSPVITSSDKSSATVVSAGKNTSSSTSVTLPSKVKQSVSIPTPSTQAPSLSKKANVIEPPQKRPRVDTVESESQKESPKGKLPEVGHKLNILKRTHVKTLGDLKDVGAPHDAKVMKKEGALEGTVKNVGSEKRVEECLRKITQVTEGTVLETKKGPLDKSPTDKKVGIPTTKTSNIEVKKTEPTRRLLKPHNFGRESTSTNISRVISSPVTPAAKTGSKETDGPEKSSKEPDVGEAIEEPVMIVKGEGEGAKCESGNNLHFSDKDRSLSSKPWWECFDGSRNDNGIVMSEDSSETIEEHVMYFWGDGNGVDCEAGNNGDETETNSETKQGESGSSTLVTTDNKGNSTSSEVKPQKDRETSRTESDVKEVDGLAESDEAKVNGLRTLDSVEKSDKVLNQPEKTDTKGEGKHVGVNGKKSNEDNDVGNEKTSVSSKNSTLGEGKNKKDKSSKENSESLVKDKCESDKGANEVSEKVQRQDSSDKEDEESNLELSNVKKTLRGSMEIKETVSETSGKRGTRNRASLEEIKDVSEDTEKDEESCKEEVPSVKKKRGRPKGTTLAARGRKSKQVRTGSRRMSEEEEEVEEDNEEDIDEDDDDNQQEPSKKRRQRGMGSTARPLPDVPRQRSARIAKIREKEEEERRNLEALRMKQLAEENRLKELKRKAREERRALREIKKGKREKKEKKDKDKKKKKRKKRVKKRTNAGDPWDNSSSSSSSSSEEEDIEEEEEDENLEFKSDHEFSPESDIEDSDAQPIKRARTAKKASPKIHAEVEDEAEEVEEEESEEDQTQCTKCGHDDHPETILLCDTCDAGWHLSCLRPPLLSVPEGDWICPTCEHVMLVKKLKEVLERFDECQKKAQNEELRRQRLAYVNVSLDNILPEGGKKKKKKRLGEDGEEEEDDETGTDSESEDSDSESDDSSGSTSESSTESEAPLYTLRARSARTLKEQVEDFDEMINEAIRDEMEAAAGAGNAGRGKDIDNIIIANNEEDEEGEDSKAEMKNEVENKENEKPDEEIEEDNEDSKDSKEEKRDENDEVKREREDDDDDDDDVSPKRKKQKPAENGSENDEDYKQSDEHHDSESEEEVKTVRKRSKPYNMFFKKRRRLTDLDAEDDDDASDEDFMNTSDEDEEESEESALSSSSLATDCDSDDSDVVGGKRRRSSRYDNLPLRRSTRNRRSGPYDEDSDDDKYMKRAKKKKRRRKSSSEEEDDSSDSETSYKRKKRVSQRRRSGGRSKSRRGNKKGRGKRQSKSKPKPKPRKASGDEEDKPAKPRIKYSKPPKSKSEDQEEEVTQRRVTRGRQVNYYDALLMSDETEEEEPQKKWRGKVMKGERVPTESSEYEASEDEMMKRRGFSGGLGRGKVMKGEEEDEEDDLSGKGKKKRGRPKKGDELIGKPSPPRPSTIKPTPLMQATSVSLSPAPVIQSTPVPPTPLPLKPAMSTPTQARIKPAATDPTSATALSVSAAPASAPPPTVPSNAPPASYLPAAASPVQRTPEPAVSPSPAPTTKVLPANVAVASNIGNNSPGHQQTLGKWSPHLSGVTITSVSAPGTPPRPSIGSVPGSGTPPRPSLSGPPVTASPPPPYRSSPLPVTPVGRGALPSSTAPSTLPPVGPPNTSSPHSTAYPPYRPPPEHYPPHPGKERFPAHPAFPEYAPPGRHSPNPHGVPPRHPSHVPSGHSLPHMPASYGPPGPGSYPPGGVPPHPGVLRGPPHDLYRPPHSTHPGHGSPSHPGHPHLVMKPGYPGLEPLPYSGSPGPSPGSIGIHQGSQDSPAQQSPNEDSKEGTLPTSKGPGEFSSGLMSYFSSQRDDDVE